MIQELASRSAIASHTDRFFDLRRLEVAAGRTFSGAQADVGDSLIQIYEELGGGIKWTHWVAEQAERARSEKLPTLEERTARDYMALAKLRRRLGERYLFLMHLDPACLYPIATLPDAEIAKLADEGIDGVPIEEATSRQIRAAAAHLRGHETATAASTREQTLAKALQMIASLGELSDDEKARFQAVVPCDELGERSPSSADAPTLSLSQPLTVLRIALADDAIAAVRQAETKCRMVQNGTGTLVSGRKTQAKSAVERLRLTILDWPAWT